jgi:MFS family permease
MSPSSRLLGAAFLYGCSTAQLNLLAVVLRQHAMSDAEIAAVFISGTVCIAGGALASGALASRIGTVRTLALGCLLAWLSIVALPYTLDSAPLAALVRAEQGFGFGLFTPMGQLLVRSQARAGDEIRAVGLFTAMFLLPTFFAPAWGEFALRKCGELTFFLSAMAPIAVAFSFVCIMPRDREPAPSNAAGYLALARDRHLWLPNAASMQSGLAYTFAASFLPLMLGEYSTPVAAYFSPFAVILLATRFFGLKHLQRLPVPSLMALGLFAYATGLGILAVSGTAVPVAVAGCLNAIGYSVIHPTAVQWSGVRYPASPRPVALVNTSFNLGSILALSVTGWLLPMFGWRGVLSLLASIVTAVLVIIGWEQYQHHW